MGGDNWAICPQCKKNVETAKREAQVAAGEAYGKVDIHEYLEMLRAAEKPIAITQTFREDYEIGINNDGTFSINYGGACEKCDFGHTFKHSEPLKLK